MHINMGLSITACLYGLLDQIQELTNDTFSGYLH